jgi:hypothetical protein
MEQKRNPLVALRTRTTRLAARGRRLHRPGDPRAGPRDADVTGRATASVGHRTAASRGETNGRTAPTQAVPWHDRSHHSGVVVPAMPMPRERSSRPSPLSYPESLHAQAYAVALCATGTRGVQPRRSRRSTGSGARTGGPGSDCPCIAERTALAQRTDCPCIPRPSVHLRSIPTAWVVVSEPLEQLNLAALDGAVTALDAGLGREAFAPLAHRLERTARGRCAG